MLCVACAPRGRPRTYEYVSPLRLPEPKNLLVAGPSPPSTGAQSSEDWKRCPFLKGSSRRSNTVDYFIRLSFLDPGTLALSESSISEPSNNI